MFYTKTNDEKKRMINFLYYKLLDLVDIEAKDLYNQKDLNILADKHKNDWNALTKCLFFHNIRILRQDTIPIKA